jgi:hypothetical protein
LNSHSTPHHTPSFTLAERRRGGLRWVEAHFTHFAIRSVWVHGTADGAAVVREIDAGVREAVQEAVHVTELELSGRRIIYRLLVIGHRTQHLRHLGGLVGHGGA